MWPWEHAIIGYLTYSIFCHLYYREPPAALEALAVASGSILPDVIDKPLAWHFAVFDSGYALGHSVFFSVPFVLGIGIVSRSIARPRAGVAFGVGFLLHPIGDIVQLIASNGEIHYELMFWPVETFEPTGYSRGFAGNFVHLFGHYLEHFVEGGLSAYMWLQIGVMALTFGLWLYDGAPVLRELIRGVTRTGIQSSD